MNQNPVNLPPNQIHFSMFNTLKFVWQRIFFSHVYKSSWNSLHMGTNFICTCFNRKDVTFEAASPDPLIISFFTNSWWRTAGENVSSWVSFQLNYEPCVHHMPNQSELKRPKCLLRCFMITLWQVTLHPKDSFWIESSAVLHMNTGGRQKCMTSSKVNGEAWGWNSISDVF